MSNLGLFSDDELPIDLRPPVEFQQYDKTIGFDYCCPRCRYRWKGNPRASAREVDEALDDGSGS